MSEYRIKGGSVLTDDDIELLCDQAERGEYPGTPGEWVVRPQGRPRSYGEELVTVTLKVPASMRAAIDVRAKSVGETRSQFVRSAIERAIA